MKGILTVKKGGYEVVVDAIPLGIRAGADVLMGNPRPVAMLALEYEVSDLGLLVRTANYMGNIGLQPSIHHWNRTAPNPDFALCLDIHHPPPELLGDPGSSLYSVEKLPCLRLRIGISGAVHKEGAQKFLSAYQDQKTAFVLFCEGLEEESADVTPIAAISSVTLFNFPFLINPLE